MIQVNRIYLIFNRLVTKKFLVDTSEISYKYEIENRCGDKIDILWVEEWLKETIKVWKFFLCYIIINIFYLIASLVNSRKSSKEKCSLS